MEKRYNSLVECVEHLEGEKGRLNAAIQLLLAEKAQWTQSKMLQEKIIYQQLTASNEENNRNLEEIHRLKQEVKRLGGKG